MDKKLFMVEFDLPEIFEKSFLEKIPEQRAYFNKLMFAGTVKSYSLALDRSRLWAIMESDSEFHLMEVIGNFPLIDSMDPYISELMFHNGAMIFTTTSEN